MATVIGLFEQYQDAERAVDQLYSKGFDKSEISVAARDRVLQDRVTAGKAMGNEAAAGAASGAVGGAAIGGLAGLLVGLGALVIPGIGPVIAAGTLATALTSAAAGAGIGAATGGLLGALVGLGVPEADANFYAEGVKRGGVLVTVHTSDDRASMAQDILRNSNALNVDQRRAEWTKQGWGGTFDDKTVPDNKYYRI